MNFLTILKRIWLDSDNSKKKPNLTGLYWKFGSIATHKFHQPTKMQIKTSLPT